MGLRVVLREHVGSGRRLAELVEEPAVSELIEIAPQARFVGARHRVDGVQQPTAQSIRFVRGTMVLEEHVDGTDHRGDGTVYRYAAAPRGTDMSRWPTEKHFTSWLTLAPHNKISGRRLLSSKTQPSANRAAGILRIAATRRIPAARLLCARDSPCQIRRHSSDVIEDDPACCNRHRRAPNRGSACSAVPRLSAARGQRRGETREPH
ncbi:MAG: hypothetical protein HY217_05395 [Candidatus Rokubacteria bacterium]|nr:hypothetical protein [Candidatus Rokubacteria bacterium]